MTAACIPTMILTHTTPVGWDLDVYAKAMQYLSEGRDPYAAGVAIQRVFHASPEASNPDIMPPYTYVYSPLTLPLLRALIFVPARLSGSTYWILYVAGLSAMLWAGWQMGHGPERTILLVLAPIAAFFPALLQSNVIFSGNLAYLLYGAILASTGHGWKRGRWSPFYCIVLCASCFKAPLLSLVMIAVLSARQQWRSAAITTSAGLLLFAFQALLWPATFRNYLDAVSLQFSFNHDFGFSPSGLLGAALFSLGKPYSSASLLFYCLYAAVVLGLLLWFSRRFLSGHFPLSQWAPVMLIGVILLNPRIKEYDVAPLCLPMALIAWRLFLRNTSVRTAAIRMFLFILAVNLSITVFPNLWKPMAGVLLIASFIAGIWSLQLEPSTQLLPFPGSTSEAWSLRHAPLQGDAG